jgi:hypothetical protein
MAAVSGNWKGVCYGGELWVAVGASGKIATSTNGTSWTTQTVSSRNWNDIAYGNGRFVAVGGSGSDDGIIATSTNGTSWTTQQIGGKLNGIAYGNGSWLIASDYWSSDNAGGHYLTSTNGTSWTTRRLGDDIWNGAAFFNNAWCIVGGDGGSSGHSAIFSFDFSNYHFLQNTNFMLRRVIKAQNFLVATGTNGYIYYSDDFEGMNPNQIGSDTWNSVAYNSKNKSCIAVCENGTITISTDDGESWNTPQQVGSTSWNGIAAKND